MKLSIIIPCLNQTPQLIQCLKSISNQTFNSYEIIVVDGASKDNPASFLKSISNNIKFISEPDLGIFDAMNKGISLAKGDWLYFMGVDDYFYDSDVLKSLTPLFDSESVKLIIGQIVYRYKDQDSIFIKQNKGLIKPIWSKKIWIRNTLPHQGMFYHNSIFKEKRYDINYRVLGDYAFNLNLWKSQVPILISNNIIATCGTQGFSKKYNLALYKEEILLKTKASSVALMPVFTFIALVKFGLKKIF
ncbi:MAG: glycosyltransferase [Flavobacteriaceae bacterium]|nr:glycosyltransferase [Flavobacteriaceae bacterium]